LRIMNWIVFWYHLFNLFWSWKVVQKLF